MGPARSPGGCSRNIPFRSPPPVHTCLRGYPPSHQPEKLPRTERQDVRGPSRAPLDAPLPGLAHLRKGSGGRRSPASGFPSPVDSSQETPADGWGGCEFHALYARRPTCRKVRGMCVGLTPGDPDLLVFLKITLGIWLQPKGIAPSWLLGTEPDYSALPGPTAEAQPAGVYRCGQCHPCVSGLGQA
ncbi:uncharacterized protein C3orf18 homolog isoform X2 [Trachypithecus francoisi]|uniref:uncharacterized protein C3orf18 homolog isoform X2 n=1 Tax=Trachypithecus francoisi TaxID=54180 RepID=UPI00141B40A1|nr:uncharacterized protein C3orf18 homolog isoform X2 [Trachypithecus francoisi]